MWNEMWDEWMNEWDLSQAKTSATDNRLQSQTKCLTFNPKIYYRDNAEDRNKLMKLSKANDSWIAEYLFLFLYLFTLVGGKYWMTR